MCRMLMTGSRNTIYTHLVYLVRRESQSATWGARLSTEIAEASSMVARWARKSALVQYLHRACMHTHKTGCRTTRTRVSFLTNYRRRGGVSFAVCSSHRHHTLHTLPSPPQLQ